MSVFGFWARYSRRVGSLLCSTLMARVFCWAAVRPAGGVTPYLANTAAAVTPVGSEVGAKFGKVPDGALVKYRPLPVGMPGTNCEVELTEPVGNRHAVTPTIVVGQAAVELVGVNAIPDGYCSELRVK